MLIKIIGGESLTGFNSHSSRLISIRSVYESEHDKGNKHVCEAIEKADPELRGVGTWVTYDPLECFRGYVLCAQEYNLANDEIVALFPDWKDQVHEVELDTLTRIFGDDYVGYLYWRKK